MPEFSWQWRCGIRRIILHKNVKVCSCNEGEIQIPIRFTRLCVIEGHFQWTVQVFNLYFVGSRTICVVKADGCRSRGGIEKFKWSYWKIENIKKKIYVYFDPESSVRIAAVEKCQVWSLWILCLIRMTAVWTWMGLWFGSCFLHNKHPQCSELAATRSGIHSILWFFLCGNHMMSQW